MSHKVFANVADGRLVCQHPDVLVEKILQRGCKWVGEDRVTAGSFFQQTYVANITRREAALLQEAKVENICISKGSNFIYSP